MCFTGEGESPDAPKILDEMKYKPQFHPTLICLETLHGVREKSETFFKLRTEMTEGPVTIGRHFLKPVKDTLEVRAWKKKEF